MLASLRTSARFIKQRFEPMTKRYLHLHEYQAMDLMHKYGVHTPLYFPATTPKEAEIAAKQVASLSKSKPVDFVVKAQVLAGGRGLGYFKENQFQGGVHVCTTPEEVAYIASKMLNNTLVTKQTGLEGKPCQKVLVTERFYIRKERYLALILDRETGGPVVLSSSVGGTNIEDIAERHPDSILKLPLDINKAPTQQQLVMIAQKMGFTDSKQIEDTAASISGLYKMFIEKDCLLVEINPFAETANGQVLVCDAKVNFDDNAGYRQSDVFHLKDETQMDPREVAAARVNLNYVGLDGNIGCMVNGAGLAMATMDLIALHNGTPANFLDVGGSAGDQEIAQALAILQDDPKVDSIFVNIFGGIMRCDTIAQGVISASKKIGLTKPIIIRLEGTNKSKAKEVLADSDIKTSFLFEEDFNFAAEKAVQVASIMQAAKKASISVALH